LVSFETSSHYVAQDHLEVENLLLLPPQCWNDSVHPYIARFCTFFLFYFR
jgi:hypothetical protein